MFRIIAIIFILSWNESCQSKSQLRIRDGRDAKEGEFPYVVSLLFYENYTSRPENTRLIQFCTGSIISQHWVLTAAHCTYGKPLKSLYIWYGDFTTSPIGNKFINKVRKLIPHPRYIKYGINELYHKSERNDLCLMLVDKLPNNIFGLLSAIDHLSLIGLPVMYVGSGITNELGKDQLRPLQVGEAGIVSCKEEVNMICVVPKCVNRFHMVQPGDSGGPLLYDGRIIGVASYLGYGYNMLRGGFTAISPHIEWIHDVMQHKNDQVAPSIPAIH